MYETICFLNVFICSKCCFVRYKMFLLCYHYVMMYFKRRFFAMDYEKVYSLTAIADKLGRSRSSVYDWLHTYKEFVEPHTVGKGRTKKYKESIFPVLSLIEDLKAEGHPNDYIRALLASEGHDIVVEGKQMRMLQF
ncbi:hypothetical protein C1N89_28685 (plasmid) [Priestia aryabhattai]